MDTRSIGNVGEDIACKFLRKQGFVIVERNYRKKWGEIDIVARYIDDVARETQEPPNVPRTMSTDLHFFEVKSVTSVWTGHKPEENVHSFKTKQIRRMIMTYIAEHGDRPFQFHVLAVYMNNTTRRAHVKWLRNIIL